MKRIMRAMSVGAIGFALAGCGEGSLGPVCTAQAVFGINLTVRDSSGFPVAEEVLGIAIDGTFADTLLALGPLDMAGAVERPGTYDISVSRFGFSTWSANGVVVEADECHVIPVSLEATLFPVP